MILVSTRETAWATAAAPDVIRRLETWSTGPRIPRPEAPAALEAGRPGRSGPPLPIGPALGGDSGGRFTFWGDPVGVARVPAPSRSPPPATMARVPRPGSPQALDRRREVGLRPFGWARKAHIGEPPQELLEGDRCPCGNRAPSTRPAAPPSRSVSDSRRRLARDSPRPAATHRGEPSRREGLPGRSGAGCPGRRADCCRPRPPGRR